MNAISLNKNPFDMGASRSEYDWEMTFKNTATFVNGWMVRSCTNDTFGARKRF